MTLYIPTITAVFEPNCLHPKPPFQFLDAHTRETLAIGIDIGRNTTVTQADIEYSDALERLQKNPAEINKDIYTYCVMSQVGVAAGLIVIPSDGNNPTLYGPNRGRRDGGHQQRQQYGSLARGNDQDKSQSLGGTTLVNPSTRSYSYHQEQQQQQQQQQERTDHDRIETTQLQGWVTQGYEIER
ncbi:hypothetical protein ABW19_dt0207899 [Dactylella cylindrospora]|nr:hypothetical protein ABW19_dt0207899 [Dactylella cylindrospora]